MSQANPETRRHSFLSYFPRCPKKKTRRVPSFALRSALVPNEKHTHGALQRDTSIPKRGRPHENLECEVVHETVTEICATISVTLGARLRKNTGKWKDTHSKKKKKRVVRLKLLSLKTARSSHGGPGRKPGKLGSWSAQHWVLVFVF